MAQFYIAAAQGPQPVEGEEYLTEIGGRAARLFIHENCPLEGPRLSDIRTGHSLGNIAPHLLARYVSTGHIEGEDNKAGRNRLGAALLLRSLIERFGAARIWQVIDAAPSLDIEGAGQ